MQETLHNQQLQPPHSRHFRSFFLGGFECSSHRRADGRRLDLIASTLHEQWAQSDYNALVAHGIRTMRDGIRWHLVESQPWQYDWSSFLPMLRAAQEAKVQVIWDLCHYGYPDDLDIWRPAFVDRFAHYAAAAARVVSQESDEVPFYCPINEMSFWAWAGGDMAKFNPTAKGRGMELKHQLVRATIAAIEAIRDVDPRARFITAEPLINVLPRPEHPRDKRPAEIYRQAQFEACDLLIGDLWPGLGGDPRYLDIVGLNFYSDNQWFLGGDTIARDSPYYRPLHDMLAEVYLRYGRPLLLAETGAEGRQRAPWLEGVCLEVDKAIKAGIPLEGVCLYPVLDYPGWDNDRHCETGLLGPADSGHGNRPLYAPLAAVLRKWQHLPQGHAAQDPDLGKVLSA
ncbi:beta-glucosidase [Methylobacillus sp.]|uniref:beta-glucosidase n=1 Tax=Methylobacillus sp. TaxID=56818 RepID=UPI002580E311|nr:beta-glucosidase [Methylobacillus sp.]